MLNKVILSVFLVASFTVCQAQTEAAALSARVNGEIQKYKAAMIKKDAKEVEKVIRGLFAKNFVETGKDGSKTTLEQFIQEQKSNIAMLNKVNKLDLKISDVKVNGMKATGNGSLVLDALINHPQDPKKTLRLQVQTKWKSVLQKINGKWMVLSDTAVYEKATLDGKPLG